MIPLTPTLNSMVPQRTSMVELPSLGFWIRSIWRYLWIEQTVVKIPNVKMAIRPIFFASLISNFTNTGIGRMATTTSETIVTTAYPVKDGPGGRHFPSLRGFQDLSTWKVSDNASNMQGDSLDCRKTPVLVYSQDGT